MTQILLFSSYVLSNSSVIPWTDTHQALCQQDFPGKNTGVGGHFLLQGIFPTEGLNPSLLYWQVDSLPLCHQESLAFLGLVYSSSRANFQNNFKFFKMYKPFPPRNRIQTSIHMYMFKDVYHTIVYNGKQTINGC